MGVKLNESTINLEKISRNEFIRLIQEKAKEYYLKTGRDKPHIKKSIKDIYSNSSTLESCIDAVLMNNFDLLMDMNEIKFGISFLSITSCENIRCSSRAEQILGIHEIGDSVFCGCTASSIDDLSLFFILYYDGNRIRGYVPKKGNCFDPIKLEAYNYAAEASEMYFIDVETISKSIFEAAGTKNEDIAINKEELSDVLAMISSINEDTTIKDIIDNYIESHNL